MIEVMDRQYDPTFLADYEKDYSLHAQQLKGETTDDLDSFPVATKETLLATTEAMVERLSNLRASTTLHGDMDVIIGTANGISAFGDAQANALDTGYVAWRDSQPNIYELSREESGRTVDIRVEDNRWLIVTRRRPLVREKFGDGYTETITKETKFRVPIHAGLDALGFSIQPDNQGTATVLAIAEDWINHHEKFASYFSIKPIETRFIYESRQEKMPQDTCVAPLGATALHNTIRY